MLRLGLAAPWMFLPLAYIAAAWIQRPDWQGNGGEENQLVVRPIFLFFLLVWRPKPNVLMQRYKGNRGRTGVVS